MTRISTSSTSACRSATHMKAFHCVCASAKKKWRASRSIAIAFPASTSMPACHATIRSARWRCMRSATSAASTRRNCRSSIPRIIAAAPTSAKPAWRNFTRPRCTATSAIRMRRPMPPAACCGCWSGACRHRDRISISPLISISSRWRSCRSTAAAAPWWRSPPRPAKCWRSQASPATSPAYKELQGSIDQPLFNRVLNGQYPPGSTVKPLVALAGLEYHEVTPHSSTFCPGWFSLPGVSHRFRDWKKEGHGTVDVRLAIMRSCDVYFYDLARTLGIDRMKSYLGHFGLGRKTNVDLPAEFSGLMPSREWKRAARKQAWYPGETLITGIGQGFMLATPLQLADAIAALAIRGDRKQPHIVRALQPPGSGQLVMQPPVHLDKVPVADPANWDTVISAMQDVVHAPGGTAQGVSRGITYHMAGKTGTAQVFGLMQNQKYKASEVDERLRDHALFVAFAPVDDPEIAVAVVVENGGSGSGEAAPVARAVLDRYFAGKPAL